jgi:hypothetical protein
MESYRLQDAVSRGLGRAALRLGESYDAYRPADPFAPITPRSFFLRLDVAFHGEDQTWNRSARYGVPVWFGVYDSAYTQVGDYLVGPLGTFFIAAQPLLLSPVCVQTNRVLSVVRPSGAPSAGLNPYGGVTAGSETVLLRDWPASVLAGGAGRGVGELPGETAAGRWVVLLPALRGDRNVVLRPHDILTDETGAISTITEAEYTALGWRLNVTQAQV